MNTSNDLVITEGRARQAFNDAATRVILPTVDNKINTSVENERIRTGVITKFYPYLDKAEVKLDKTHKKIKCKILHRFGGELIDLYTPLANKVMVDNNHEKYVVPRVTQHVCVLNINDEDSQEHIILGYYRNKNISGLNPAKPGNMRISALGVTNDFYIQFGLDGLINKLPKKSTVKVGYFDEDMSEVDYASSGNVYTKEEVYNKEEVYTKEEVDELIQKKVAEALENTGGG